MFLSVVCWRWIFHHLPLMSEVSDVIEEHDFPRLLVKCSGWASVDVDEQLIFVCESVYIYTQSI